MLSDEVIAGGQHVMTVCNACRYCEGFCPVFPAMENRLTFSKGDLTYLANLCHSCGECLYACQYAPPHEFGINVPRTLAEIRLGSYEEYCWPAFLSGAFKSNGLLTALSLAIGSIALLFASTAASGAERLRLTDLRGDFYQVVPHAMMVVLFAGVSVFVLGALIIGCVRFRRDERKAVAPSQVAPSQVVSGFSRTVTGRPKGGHYRDLVSAVRDALTLTHLHGGDVDCTHAEESRSPWRRWFHHFAFYGFLLCFASTSVAALYHVAFGWRAPYGYASLPVVLGTAGGMGLLIGPMGLFVLRQTRDGALTDPAQEGLDTSFIVLLFLTSLTGLVLLGAREEAAMPALLLVHLGFVLALFLTLPYGKFVHGIYRTAALIRYARETRADG